jgi:hypothetical protein
MDEFLHDLKLAPIKVGAGSFMGPIGEGWWPGGSLMNALPTSDL